MKSVEEALAAVLAETHPRPAEQLPLAECLGLVLAEEIASDIDSPASDKALVDGYAIVAADVVDGRAELSILEEVTAGAVPTRLIAPGQATRIMTGAPLPEGADAVVMVEQTDVVPGASTLGRVRIQADKVTPGQNIMRRAASMARGQRVLAAGCELRGVELGLLAEVGRATVPAIPRPTVAVLSTGNELVEPRETPPPGKVRNSNGPMLVALATTARARAADLGIARDEPKELRDLVARGLESDVLVVSGGVSAGVLDLVPATFEALGVRRVFHKVQLKPGKPLWFGVHGAAGRQRLVFGLPGNPVSGLVCFELFVRPAVARLAGREFSVIAETARLAADFAMRGDRPTFHPARLTLVDGQSQVEPLRWQGSGDLRALAEANALACFPAGTRQFTAGEEVPVRRLD